MSFKIHAILRRAPRFDPIRKIIASMQAIRLVLPQLRRLVPGLSAPKPSFAPREIYVEFVMDKVVPDRFISESLGFPLSVSSFHRCSIFTRVSTGGCAVGPSAGAVPQRQYQMTSSVYAPVSGRQLKL